MSDKKPKTSSVSTGLAYGLNTNAINIAALIEKSGFNQASARINEANKLVDSWIPRFAFQTAATTNAINQITKELSVYSESFKIHAGSFNRINNDLALTLGQFQKAIEVSEFLKSITANLPKNDFRHSFAAVTASAIAKGSNVAELGSTFDEVYDSFEIIDSNAADFSQKKHIEQQEELLNTLAEVLQRTKNQKVKWYLSTLMALILFSIARYFPMDSVDENRYRNIESLLEKSNYEKGLENTGELVASTIRQEILVARIPTPLRYSPISNSGVICYLKKEQEILIIYRVKKYAYIVFNDCDTGELHSGFALKKHFDKK